MLRLSASLLAAAVALVAVPLGAGASGYTPGVMVTCDTPNPTGAEVPGTAATPDQVSGEGETSCLAYDVADPAATITVSGSIRLELWLDELNPSTGVGQFVRYASAPAQPLVAAGDLATGATGDLRQGVPAAGQTDPATGWQSLGLGEYYVGVTLVVDGVTQPTGPTCRTGDDLCEGSAAFPVL